MKRIRKEQENETPEAADEKPTSFVRALMHKKYNLTDEEIRDEIRTMLVAVSIKRENFKMFLTLFSSGTRHHCNFRLLGTSSSRNE